MWRVALVLLCVLPNQVAAQTAEQRPISRPQVAAALPADALPTRVPLLRPLPRPATILPLVAVQPLATAQPDASIRRLSVLRPLPRPEGGLELAAAATPAPQVKPERRKKDKKEQTSRKGSVCDVAAIKGEEIARITSAVKGCGIAEPVRVTSVSGVRLSQPATLDCDTARALNHWVETGLQPAFGPTKVVELRVAAHYICRSRNNVKGVRISEHGRGKAIDIAGITLESGKTVAVLGGFGKELRRAHKAACGTFGTTLGPGSDGFHEDHMHFDTAKHRNGPYCR